MRFARGIADLVKLHEDGFLMLRRDADAGVAHFDAHVRAAPAGETRNAARRRILQRIGDQVGEQPVEQSRVGMDVQAGIAKAQDQPLAAALRANVTSRRAKLSASGWARSCGAMPFTSRRDDTAFCRVFLKR